MKKGENMKEINLGKTIANKRRDKDITQDELAAYMGVSKASVSKWETGQSYPDIVLLPQLATYFNISIDELIGYSPQLTKEDIKKLYHRLAADFAAKPFDNVRKECTEIARKYFSCFPLLLQMVILMVNHHMLAPEVEQKEAMLREAIEICKRIKTESEDVWLSKEANSLQGVCYLMLQQPLQVLELLEESLRPFISDYESVAQAYQLLGKLSEAKKVMQISMYQHLISFVGSMPSYIMMNVENVHAFEEILNKALSVVETYNLDYLHPNTTLRLYYAAAQAYSMHGEIDRTLDFLQRYTDISVKEKTVFTLHGDSIFDSIDSWIAEFDLGNKAPRSEKVIRESILSSVIANPAFAAISDNPRFKSIVEKLKEALI